MNELAVSDKGADWRRLKDQVLDPVSSLITKRVRNLGRDEFFAWYGQEPRLGLTNATVAAWWVASEARGLGAVSINVRITGCESWRWKPRLRAVCVGAGEWNHAGEGRGFQGLAPLELLTGKPAQALLSAPGATTNCGIERSGDLGYPPQVRIATLGGRGRSPSSTSSSGDGRWCIADLVGRHGRLRTVPMTTWVEVAIDA
jgi:hypothetical protein